MSRLSNSPAARGYVKVTVSKNKQVRCEVTSGSLYLFYECVHCGDFTETAQALLCSHYLCEECYSKCTAYACSRDGTVTKKEEASRRISLCDYTYDTLCLKCPKCFLIYGNCRKTAGLTKKYRHLPRSSLSGAPQKEKHIQRYTYHPRV
ncbi:hypothetical protein V5799_006738 [Amblyomma americanum]|uniref:Uncharacterized protein n=1 Tax=Amblyomma americanum TaxID=6943 RepID=A0AAQ4DVJ3_AMBAM